jgi:hypothetical protein
MRELTDRAPALPASQFLPKTWRFGGREQERGVEWEIFQQ